MLIFISCIAFEKNCEYFDDGFLDDSSLLL